MYTIIIAIFVLGYAAIILEHPFKINKAAVGLLTATLCWAAYFIANGQTEAFSHHVSDVAQILFFLMGAMAIVELVDSHGGFSIVTDLIHTTSKRNMLWIIAFISFFLSSVLDNLTTTILMISLLRKLVSDRQSRLFLCFIVVIAANAGGAWTPIGDVTTTMLWINGQISSLAIMKSLFIPSLVSLLVPLLIFTFRLKGNYERPKQEKKGNLPGKKRVFIAGVSSLVFVPVFKALTGLPPFMGVLIGLGVLWLMTDLIHHKYEERQSLRIPHILTRIDISGILFFLGILLAVNALETVGVLQQIAEWLATTISSLPLIATFIGLVSAIIDNVPLVAATMGMYSYPTDHTFWHMIAYTAGTGGSILIIGSAAGVALMGLEKVDFLSYLKKASLPTLLGYLAGIGAYLLLQ